MPTTRVLGAYTTVSCSSQRKAAAEGLCCNPAAAFVPPASADKVSAPWTPREGCQVPHRAPLPQRASSIQAFSKPTGHLYSHPKLPGASLCASRTPCFGARTSSHPREARRGQPARRCGRAEHPPANDGPHPPAGRGAAAARSPAPAPALPRLRPRPPARRGAVPGPGPRPGPRRPPQPQRGAAARHPPGPRRARPGGGGGGR